MMREYSIWNLTNVDDVKILGNDVIIDGLNLCNRVTDYCSILSYATNEKYLESVKLNKSIKVLVVSEELVDFYKSNIDRELAFVVVKHPEMFFYRTHNHLYYKTDFYGRFDFISKIGQNCNIHDSVVINPGVIVGDNVTIGANSVINKGSVIEDGAYIGCNTTIGSEGFQVIDFEDHRENIKHVGGTLIKRNAYIGDNTAICNSLFEGNTIIEENARVDNLVHVAHNCYVGKSAILTAGVILCGSSIIEDDAWIGVNSSVLNNVVIGKRSKLGIGSVATRSVPDDRLAYGVPAKVK